MSGSQGRCCRHDFHFPIQKSRNLDMVPREHDYLKALSGNRESGSDQGEWFRFKSLVSITWIKRGLSSIFRALFLDDRIAELGANRNRGYPSCTRCRKEGLKSSISSIFGGYFEVIHLEIRDFVRSDPRRRPCGRLVAHSKRSARMGSMRLARRAGINPAATETNASSKIVPPAIEGSFGLMP